MPKKTRKQPLDEKAPNRVVALESAYLTRHQTRWGILPTRKIGYERKELKTLVEQHSDDELIRLMDLYLDPSTEQRSEQVKRSDFTLLSFTRLVPMLRLLQIRRRGTIHQRTAENVDQARRATGRKD